MDTLKLTELLADRLGIEIPPVGLAFVQERPADVPPLYRDPPSFCSLWRMAELRVLYASAEQHNGCGIGGVVSGFMSDEGQEEELAALLTEMCDAEVGTTEEIAQTARFVTIPELERLRSSVANASRTRSRSHVGHTAPDGGRAGDRRTDHVA